MTLSDRENSKRIAKNTLLLYARMLLLMAVGLYTSRVILVTLGVDDYGVYNVVAGFVLMFSFFTSSLGAAISRYLTYELGRGETEVLKRIFSTSVNVQLLMAIGIVLLAEPFGIWFLNNKLNIPDNRLWAAHWVFQCSIVSFIFNLISVPYNAAIIAHEKMAAFAYISILDVFLKLLIVYLLYISPFDRLVTYAVLFAMVGFIIRLAYSIYCKHHFPECRYNLLIDKKMMRNIAGFAGWNLIGSGVYLFNTQGINIAMNLFFGVTVNAARGIATQIESVVRQFVTSFTTALNPQITKSYAVRNMDYMYKLVCRGSKYSYLLMLFFVVPLVFEAETALAFWLKVVPDQTAVFVRLTMLGLLCDVLGNATANACWATGRVKKYYLWVGAIGSLVFFISYSLFVCGLPAYSSYIVFIIIYAILVFVKVHLIKGLINFPVKMFYQETIGRILPVSIITFAFGSVPSLLFPASVGRLFLTGVVSTLVLLLSVYFWGLEESEKTMVLEKLALLRNKIIHR